ncbi:MAG: AraC family transcriptional regulator [Treponema sp.]|jgi:AraC-like DNA-binding protein|nr:AraC family transcriptional regulator [Treponema sp.]
MDRAPWYEKQKLDPVFPFRIINIPLQDFAFHWHELIEITLVLKGSVSVSIDGKPYVIREGDLAVINSGAIHGYRDSRVGVENILFLFSLEIFGEDLGELWEKNQGQLVFARKPVISATEDSPVHRRLSTLLKKINKEYSDKKSGWHLAIKTKLYEFALILLREIPPSARESREIIRMGSNRKILEQVFSFIHHNYTDPEVTLEEAAQAASLSKFYFTRFFKEQTGQTFHTYLSRIRVNRAEEYLTGSDMTITDIAYQCGFGSVKTFNRIFKTYTSISPSIYRSGFKRQDRSNF